MAMVNRSFVIYFVNGDVLVHHVRGTDWWDRLKNIVNGNDPKYPNQINRIEEVVYQHSGVYGTRDFEYRVKSYKVIPLENFG